MRTCFFHAPDIGLRGPCVCPTGPTGLCDSLQSSRRRWHRLPRRGMAANKMKKPRRVYIVSAARTHELNDRSTPSVEDRKASKTT